MRTEKAPVGLIHVTVTLKPLANGEGRAYEELFLVDTGATDSLAPGSKLKEAGIEPVGRMAYELADGSTIEYDFGLTVIEFMGEITAGRVIFGPDNAEPLLGVTALESVGILVDPASQKLKRLPAVPLKSIQPPSLRN
jgi:clan AA aspartic protease